MTANRPTTEPGRAAFPAALAHDHDCYGKVGLSTCRCTTASPAALDARCPTCGREAIPASITTGHEHGPMETCDECQYHPTEQDDEAATPPLDVLADAIRQAVEDEPWYDTEDQRPVETFTEAYARKVAERVAARLAQQDGTGE